ncbi:MAG: phenylacetate--CoA ligase family protein [Algoriphagus sp.]|uniref:phenylacetate--CoA ligase family protein n=1 Tax=Algoriphagus sp. TaxID=1872435 RepID=UPI0018463677|nr:phenylacetate--CoA ligase family protein [Algoriphagus sp.]NVJ86772.1 phenylacetate--CoA ligase family protein [Algoriphagus sp.]
MLTIESLLRLKNYPLDKAFVELDRIQSFSKEEYFQWQEKKKWDLVKFHHNHNPLYKKLVGKYLPDSWEELPIVKKKDLQQNSDLWLSEGINKKDLHFGSTSGSSGLPLKFARDKFCHSLIWALILDRYQKVGISSSDFQARFFGIPLAKTAYFKERIKDFLMNRYRFVIFDISDKALDGFIQKFREKKIKYLYGYTNSQLTFARHLNSKGLTLKEICPTVTCSIVTSEQCTEEDKKFLEEVFKIPVYNEYGAAEVAFLAMTDQNGVRRLSNETVLTEVLDDEGTALPDGQTGRLIFTNLFNKAMPFIRYEVGDFGAIEKDPIFIQDKLIRLQGRLNDKVFLPSGKVAAGFSLYYVSKHLMSTLGYIQEYQVQQFALDKFLFLVVMDHELNDSAKKIIQTAFDTYLEKGLEIEIQKVNFIDREKSGKLKHFISHLKQNGK